jgi:alpha-beta hydrolase superfamily lysophospholipase
MADDDRRASSAIWERVASLMTPRGYDCLAPSLPAHDASPSQRLQVGGQSLRDYLAFLEHMVATREDQRPPHHRHSMGGLLAQQLATRVQPVALVFAWLRPLVMASPASR